MNRRRYQPADLPCCALPHLPHLKEEFEKRLAALHGGDAPDPRDAQIARLKETGDELRRKLALSRLAAQHDEITRLRRQAATTAGNVRSIASASPAELPQSARRHDDQRQPDRRAASLRSRPSLPRSRRRTAHRERRLPAPRRFVGRFIAQGTSGGTHGRHRLGRRYCRPDAGHIPCSSGECRILLLAASIAGGIPVSLGDTLPGIDRRNARLVINAISRAMS